jgi:carbamoyl-phosphate synthase large subunit
MKEYRILITSVGGLVAPGIIKSLKQKATENSENMYIVGTDMRSGSVGFHFVDKSYIVPSGESKNYNSALLKIARENNVNLIVPCSDEELLSISREKQIFLENGIIPICSDYTNIVNANDKGLMLKKLQENKVVVPKYYLPSSIEDVKKAAENLGYPSQPFVIKPRIARGGRGFKLIKENVTLYDNNCLNLEHLLGILNPDEIEKFILMEYLPGEEYSVDALALNGKALYIIPRKRITALGGPSIVGEIVENKEVRRFVENVIGIFNLHLNINIQLKYSSKNMPLIVEINPRTSGTIVANGAAGINLLYYGIKLAMGEDIPYDMKFISNMKMQRYFEEVFTYEE